MSIVYPRTGHGPEHESKTYGDGPKEHCTPKNLSGLRRRLTDYWLLLSIAELPTPYLSIYRAPEVAGVINKRQITTLLWEPDRPNTKRARAVLAATAACLVRALAPLAPGGQNGVHTYLKFPQFCGVAACLLYRCADMFAERTTTGRNRSSRVQVTRRRPVAENLLFGGNESRS